MSDDLIVGRVVFLRGGDTVYAGEGKLSPNPLEYAPRGTLEELKQAQARIKEFEGLVGEMVKALDGCSVFLIRLKKDLLHPDSIKFGAGVLSHSIDEILDRPLVKEIMGKEKTP